MAMDNATLSKLGLTEEQITNVIKEHKSTIDGEYIPKHKFDEKVQEVKNLKEQKEQNEKALEDLKKVSGDSEKFKQELERIKAEKKLAEEKYAADLLETKKTFALRQKLSDQVIDVDVAMSLFNKDNIVLNEKDEITAGFEDVFGMIKKDKSYLLKNKDGAETDSNKSGIKFFGNGVNNPEQTGSNKSSDAQFVDSLFSGNQSAETTKSILSSYLPNLK